MDDEQILKSTQEQAVASWVNQLNQIRLDDLMEKLTAQDCNLKEALDILNKAKSEIFTEVVVKNRGNDMGIHGFIGEWLQVAIANAKNVVDGLKPEYRLVNDNGSVDYFRNDTPIQLKLQKSNHLGFTGNSGIAGHWDKYPAFHEKGVYQVSKEAYELFTMPEETAKKLVASDANNSFSYSKWKQMHKVLNDRGIDAERIEPTEFDYADAQKKVFSHTLNREKEAAQEEAQQQRNVAYEQSKPTVAEGARAADVSAAIEGGTHFVLAVHRKLKEGKKLAEFTAEDWKDVGLDTAQGTVTGGVRGAAIYGMTNFTATPAAVASAFVTAAVGIAAQVKQLEQGAISEDDFVCNSTVLCLDVSISAIASLAGQVLIPIPVLGAVVGNCVGMFYWGICKEYASEREQRLVEGYRQSMDVLNEQLDARYADLLAQILAEFKKFVSVQELAFDENVNRAFEGAVALARYVGVPEEKILSDTEKIDHFFMD